MCYVGSNLGCPLSIRTTQAILAELRTLRGFPSPSRCRFTALPGKSIAECNASSDSSQHNDSSWV